MACRGCSGGSGTGVHCRAACGPMQETGGGGECRVVREDRGPQAFFPRPPPLSTLSPCVCPFSANPLPCSGCSRPALSDAAPSGGPAPASLDSFCPDRRPPRMSEQYIFTNFPIVTTP